MNRKTHFLLSQLKTTLDNPDRKNKTENTENNEAKQKNSNDNNSSVSSENSNKHKKKPQIMDKPQLQIVTLTPEQLQQQKAKEKPKELAPSNFYSKNKEKSTQRSPINSSFARELSNMSKSEHHFQDRSAQSSPQRRPSNHQSDYIPFRMGFPSFPVYGMSRPVMNTTMMRPAMNPTLVDSPEDPPQGTRFIIEGAQSTEEYLTLICVNEDGYYVVLNNKKKTIEWWPPYDLYEIGGPIEVEPISCIN